MRLFRLFPLRIAIQSIFISIFVLLVGVIIFLSSHEYSRSIAIFSKKLMIDAANNISLHLESELSPTEHLINITQSLMDKEMLHPQQMVDYTYYIAKNLPHYANKTPIRIAGWGDQKGNLVETSLETDGTFSTAIIRPHDTPPVGVRLYRDHNGKIIKKESIATNDDPDTRLWYIAAKNAGHAVWTNVFLSYPYKNLSIASAFPFYSKQNDLLGVFEIEVKLIGLTNLLSVSKISENSQIVILNEHNELVIYAGMNKELYDKSQSSKIDALVSSGKLWMVDSLKHYDKTHEQYFRYRSGGKSYLAYYIPIPKIGYLDLKIGVMVPEDDFTGNLKRANTRILIVSFIILLLGVLLTWFVSQRISRSLNALVKDTQRIKDFHLDNHQIHSNIAEIAFLNNAMEAMKSSLRAFKKFVPTDLVRQLIQSGEGVGIGGVSRNVSIFFSDIVGFTSISEHMDPQHLMSHLCDYFEELSRIISDEKGTIDKYIGDSIMAFWGAPLTDDVHCFHACETALRCKARLDILNARWEKENKPQLITAIGIHTGEAIVGNIGSSARLNYTVLGDSINFTSRLVIQSKLHGAKIIVSESVVNAVKGQFLFRLIETVEIRGKAGTYKIYELVDKASTIN